ncbi:calcium-activated chloride channel regulator 1-like [Strongylocentrotus purpuratus]|uniref:VWFA domain-containing protein n=1 Tax=Strongylocentrotus purpuratus TaxID=7668 RepID=A0A7M7NSF3_STRPU|nr:calcium-activated chloride channel regulator 1-like [Strongylocentrotus purpuratus]
MFREGSTFLYQATRQRVFFKNVTILIPSHWTTQPEYGSPGRLTFDTADVIIAQPNPLWAPEPYTQQIQGCGQPGSFIHFTEDFITDDDDVTDTYGELGRILVHEWGHYRWGLFNEYPDDVGDADHVTHFYQSMEGNQSWKPVICSQEYQWFPKFTVQGDPPLFKECVGNLTDGYQAGCQVLIQGAGQASGSIMHGPLTYSNIVNFCDDDSDDPGNLHNREAPNKHNRLCNSRSAWEVMREHDDFKGLSEYFIQFFVLFHRTNFGLFINIWSYTITTADNSPASNLNVAQIKPSFDLVQAGTGDECRVVLVLDTSGSMRTSNRIDKVNSAATAFVNLVDDGIWIGIVTFTGSPTTEHALTQINTQADRDSLRDIFQLIADGGTCIGCGLERGLEVLMDHPSGSADGGIIVLMTDGQDSGIQNHIIRQTLQDMGVRVNTMAIGEDTYGELNLIAQETGVNVEITQPNNATITSGNQQYTVDTTRKVVTVAVDGLAMSGKWLYSIENAVTGSQSVTFSVYSRINMLEEEEPIVVKSTVGNSIMDLSSKLEPLAAYAQIRQGSRPVVNAVVRAVVEKPGGSPADIIELRDDGAGADITANDGIYSRFFTNIIGTGFYGIRTTYENDGSAIILTRARTGISRVQAAIRVTDDGMIISPGNIGSYEVRLPGVDSNQPLQGTPAPSFTRSSSAGSTTITNLPAGFTPGQDLFPPNRVQDLRVTMTHVGNQTLVLSWIAPGDDLDTGTATSYDIRMGNSSRQLLDDFTNTTRVSSSSILKGNLTSPSPSGSLETFVIMVPDMPELNSFSYSFALRATDDDGKTSQVSNVAIATFRRVVPTAPPPGPCIGITCLNGGELEDSNCTCLCSEDFQGNLCQHNKSQLRNGVQIHLQVNITQCEQLLNPLISASSDQLNVYCLSNLATCCPGGGVFDRPQGEYVREEDVMIADGYPILADQSDGCYVVLYAIRPNEPELCMGSGSSKRRKRSILEIHRKRRQLPDQLVYIPQSLLLDALSSGEVALEMAVGTDIDSITLPRVEGDPLIEPSTVPAYLIGVIVAIVTFSVIVILCLCVSCARMSVRNDALKERDFNRDRERSDGPRFMRDGPPPPRNIPSISERTHLQINPSQRLRQPGHRSPPQGDDDMYAVASSPMSIYHRPDVRGDMLY